MFVVVLAPGEAFAATLWNTKRGVAALGGSDCVAANYTSDLSEWELLLPTIFTSYLEVRSRFCCGFDCNEETLGCWSADYVKCGEMWYIETYY